MSGLSKAKAAWHKTFLVPAEREGPRHPGRRRASRRGGFTGAVRSDITNTALALVMVA